MMPDKIYVREYPDGINQFWERKKRDDVVATIHHEYLRKDALLKKLNRAIELQIKSGANETSDGVMTLNAIIRYIESL